MGSKASDKLPKPRRTGRACLSALGPSPGDILLEGHNGEGLGRPEESSQRGSSQIQISLEDSRTPGAARRYHDLEDDIRSIESSESIL
eukprot:s1434_g15.t1